MQLVTLLLEARHLGQGCRWSAQVLSTVVVVLGLDGGLRMTLQQLRRSVLGGEGRRPS